MTDQQAYDIESLAVKWRCSKRSIYSMIETGELRTFKIGKRGMRVSAEEVSRWERERDGDAEAPIATNRAIARSGGGKAGLSRTSAMKALASARG